MNKDKIRKDDGRYLLYYTFEKVDIDTDKKSRENQQNKIEQEET